MGGREGRREVYRYNIISYWCTYVYNSQNNAILIQIVIKIFMCNHQSRTMIAMCQSNPAVVGYSHQDCIAAVMVGHRSHDVINCQNMARFSGLHHLPYHNTYLCVGRGRGRGCTRIVSVMQSSVCEPSKYFANIYNNSTKMKVSTTVCKEKN